MLNEFQPGARRHWWQTAAVYEIYLRSFQDSNGDGIGDLPGLISRLDYLKGTERSLNVDAIWLTPIYPSPQYDFGYDVADFCDIDPSYGSLADFDRLVARAHSRDLRIVMDLVANHTSHLHPWFVASRSGRHGPYREWYSWRDPAPGGGPPNNWRSVFGGPAWTLDPHTGQYYLHSFLKEQPDLNWRNPEVQDAMASVIRFWVERGVDGFRIDAVAHIAKHPDLLDDPPTADVPLHSRNHPDIYAWLDRMRHAADVDGECRLLISEVYGLTPDEVRQYHGTEQHPRVSMSFNFAPVHAAWSASAYRTAVESFQTSLPPGVWPNVVLNNHDVPRSSTRYAAGGDTDARLRVAALYEMTLPGAVYLYYGEEIGMRNVDISPEQRRDVGSGPDWQGGRDPARTPMQWSDEPHAGFTTGIPWLPVGPDFSTHNVAVQEADPDSLLSLYRRLLRVRVSTPALQHGTYGAIPSPPGTYCFLRVFGSDRILVALNFSDTEQSIDLRSEGPVDHLLLSTHAAGQHAETVASCVRLAPSEGVVLQLG